MEAELLAKVEKLNAELEKMSPNMKAIERCVILLSSLPSTPIAILLLILGHILTSCRLHTRLDDSEARFDAINTEFEIAREAAKEARETFTSIRKQRCDLFNKAYTHISDKIDDVYKDLTKGKSAPMGGVAYLTLEDSEVSRMSSQLSAHSIFTNRRGA